MKPLFIAALFWFSFALAGSPASNAVPTRGGPMFREYFRAETARLSGACLTNLATRQDWEERRGEYRRQLREMLGLWPLPPRTELKAVVTGKTEHAAFTVENLHFQSLPGLYVTANVYVPKGLARPAPAILYLCGHGPVISNGISYGNKVAYQHHGAWFARNGYVCLVLDTLQLGEIQGLHHGTYRENMWWWNARGYTPAGVEAWNSIRALDYLETSPEVDASRLGVTGRSGGGAYSWWIAALDDRIQAAAPVAGITDLQNHVVDGVVDGHCDCMFIVNTYRWDYPQVAALAAPRPLLIVNTDSDTIFPLDGVCRAFTQVRRIYELCGARDKLGLVIGPGPHKDTQDLQIPVLRWFNRHLKKEEPVIETAAAPLFTPQQLKVFNTPPADAINTNIQAVFVPAAEPPAPPQSQGAWESQREAWLAGLKKITFAGWPQDPAPLDLKRRWSVEKDGLRFEAFDFTSQLAVRLRFYVLQPAGTARPERTTVMVLDRVGDGDCPGFQPWLESLAGRFGVELEEELGSAVNSLPPEGAEAAERRFAAMRGALLANRFAYMFVAARGIGLTAAGDDEREQTRLRRRFMLLGQTLDGMRVWDIRRAIQAARAAGIVPAAPLGLAAAGPMAVNALYAAIFEPDVTCLELRALPASHKDGPDLLNVLRVLDLPQALALAAERSRIQLWRTDPRVCDYTLAVRANLGWGTVIRMGGNQD